MDILIFPSVISILVKRTLTVRQDFVAKRINVKIHDQASANYDADRPWLLKGT